MKGIDIGRLLASLAVCYAASGIGALATGPAVQNWYPTLAKPAFNPPNWVFAPVWTVLFTLMGIALFLVWRQIGIEPGVRTAMALFGVQLVLNVLWSVLFFGLRMPLAGFIEILVLWVAIALTIASFFRFSAVAGWLLVPYIAWVSFAAVLNFAIWRLNP